MNEANVVNLELTNLPLAYGLVVGYTPWYDPRYLIPLAGMMTGQILSGTDPVVAVRYQIAIMCAITGAVSITASLILWLGYRRYFSKGHQLLPES